MKLSLQNRTPKVIRMIHILLAITILFSKKGKSQENELPIKTMPAQLTLIYPVGSNGINSYLVKNHFSVNILAGVSAGVEGFEIGGIANMTKGDINGVQGAGLVNLTHGNMHGIQLAGTVNAGKGDITGIQSAGIINFNHGSLHGAQFAGTVNATTRKSTGAQFAGAANLSVQGFHGFQGAGVLNVNTGDFKGVQLSGVVNVSTGDMQGAQISLVNFAKNVSGIQIGLVNVGDSIRKGAGFGLITYYRNGYHAFELEANETMHANLTFKSGVEKFYMIYTVGIRTKNEEFYWSPGIGVGSLSRLNDKLAINVDLISRHINEDKWWTNELNMLNTAKVTVGYNLNDKVFLYGGPSYNVVVSGIKDLEGNVIGDGITGNTFYDHIGTNNRVKMFVGFSGGIRF